jgi:hypothetical protein
MHVENESSPPNSRKSVPPAGMFKVIVALDAQHHGCLSPSSGN